MCELLGFCSKNKYKINDYLKEFYSHCDMHPNGWGLACIDGSNVMIEKEPEAASKSYYLKKRLTMPIVVNTAIAHIRYATIGNVEYKNCHPFYMKDNSLRAWTLVHNGTIFDYQPLNKFVKSQYGDTDSERILLYIIEKINAYQSEYDRPLTKEERFNFLDSYVSDLSKGNKLNLIIYDGEYLYVHTNYKNSLYFLENDKSIVFSTRPLKGENWKPVPFTALLAYKDGEQVYKGTNHGNEYIDNEEDMKLIYQMFSYL